MKVHLALLASFGEHIRPQDRLISPDEWLVVARDWHQDALRAGEKVRARDVLLLIGEADLGG